LKVLAQTRLATEATLHVCANSVYVQQRAEYVCCFVIFKNDNTRSVFEKRLAPRACWRRHAARLMQRGVSVPKLSHTKPTRYFTACCTWQAKFGNLKIC